LIEKTPDLELTSAVSNDRIIAMYRFYLLGFGPRLGTAALELAAKLHPDILSAAVH
jgi:ABC-type hemin transport system substrate-binding protein